MVDLTLWVMPLLFVAVTIALTALFAWVAGLVIQGLMTGGSPQVTSATRRIAFVVIWAIGVVLALQELGVGVTILLLIIGLAGVGVLLALREPLENYGARFFSDVYSPFKLGDTISVGDCTGKVIEINAITTVLLTESDHLIALPNSVFLREPVENLSPEAWRELVVPISLAGSVDLAAFESTLLKHLAKLRLRLDPRFPPIFTTKGRTLQSTELVLTVMVRRPEDRDALLSEVNLRVSETVARMGRPPAAPQPS